jgi:hypothetical protein
LDDSNSLLRYLLYSHDFETEALIYASSGPHWKGDGKGTLFRNPRGGEDERFGLNLCPCPSWRWAEDEQFIHDAVEVYAQAYPNLRVHNPDYPDPSALRSRILWGNVEFVGDFSKDTEGSNYIRSLLLDQRDGPLYLLAWGGMSTIASALRSIEDEFGGSAEWPLIQRRVSNKAIIQAFGDQDNVYEGYIGPHWPDIEFRQMRTPSYGYGARNAALPEDQVYFTAKWTAENISSKGPMGEHYRVWGDGKQMVKDDPFDHFGFAGLDAETLKEMGYVVWTPVQEPGSWISEGDTSTFMNLLNNGLRSHVDHLYGGWGGRSGQDIGPNGPDDSYATARFFGAAQRDLASRFEWAVTPEYSDANHPPQVTVSGAVYRDVRPGEQLTLRALASDPDGDAVAIKWWHYHEADTYEKAITIANPTRDDITLAIPENAQPGQTIHLILEGTDDGNPPLTRYERVVLRITD